MFTSGHEIRRIVPSERSPSSECWRFPFPRLGERVTCSGAQTSNFKTGPKPRGRRRRRTWADPGFGREERGGDTISGRSGAVTRKLMNLLIVRGGEFSRGQCSLWHRLTSYQETQTRPRSLAVPRRQSLSVRQSDRWQHYFSVAIIEIASPHHNCHPETP